jgi:hypothetical protein
MVHERYGKETGNSSRSRSGFLSALEKCIRPREAVLRVPDFLFMLIIYLLPVTFLIRQAAQSLPAQPGLGRILCQIGWTIAATALAIMLGIFSFYPPDVKDDLQTTQYWVQLGLQSTRTSSLPKQLQNGQKRVLECHGGL